MNAIEYIGLIASILGTFAYTLYRIDHLESKIEERMSHHDARIDTLYQMFVDLLKEGKK